MDEIGDEMDDGCSPVYDRLTHVITTFKFQSLQLNLIQIFSNLNSSLFHNLNS
jgi:hypothetical protein